MAIGRRDENDRLHIASINCILALYTIYTFEVPVPKLAPKIGEFELLVILAILRQRETPFANEVRRDLVDNARRSVTRGALVTAVDDEPEQIGASPT